MLSIRVRRAVALALAAALAVSLAFAAPALAQDGEAQVRVAHLSPDAPNVDVYVNGEPVSALTNVPFGTVSPYLPLPEGTQNVQVFAAGDTSEPVIGADVELAGGMAYTVGAVGLVEDGSLTAQVYEDDLSAPAEGNAKLRAVHAVPDAPAVDIVPEGGEALVEGLEFPNASPYAEVPAGDYTINVNAAGTDDTLLSAAASPAAGGVYSAFAIGSAEAGNLDLLVVQDSVGGMAEMPDTGGVSPVDLAALAGAFALVAIATGGLFAVRRSRA
jgi:hypothetical protein